MTKDIFFVQGAVNACIYDLRGDKVALYHLDKEAKISLNNLFTKSRVSENDSKLIQKLKSLNLIDSENLKISKTPIVDKNLISISFAWIEVTNKCNFKCIHCYGMFGEDKGKIIQLNDFEVILNNLKQLQVDSIQLIGGEPLIIGKKLKDYIILATKFVKNIEIYTNASLIDDDFAKFFKDKDIKIAISAYDSNNNHDKITKRNGSFIRLQKSIKILESYDIPYRVAIVKTKLNPNATPKNLKESLNITKGNVRDDVVRLTGRGNLSLLDINLIERQLITIENFKSNKIQSDFVKSNMVKHNCFSSKIYIDVNLDVYPCVMERKVSYGNMMNQDLSQILTSNNNLFNFTKDNIEECKDCEFRYACFDCRPNNPSENFSAKPWYCSYDPYIGKWKEKKPFIQNIINGSNL
ncbi:MAG: radical SAM protein [Leptospiraceae bacterium]|nr:radical SAM protein [Leptospiraceae bacterium]